MAVRKGVQGLFVDEDEGAVLVKGTSSTTYEILLRKAEKEGRLNGQHRCPICGMRFHTSAEAEACCERVRERF